jgi:16S rRNA (uracil1498-N3)-methyltransferase
VSVSPERELSELTKMASPLRLFIGTPSSSVMETIVQHTTEIGVAEIVMYRAERTQLNLDSEAREKISKRLTKIAISALKQSGAARLPKIRVTSDPIVDLLQGPALKKSFVGSLSTNNDILRILTENGRFFNEFEGSPNNADFISVIIGPEGGLSDTEEERLIQLGVTPYSLGPAALRVETASIVTAGIINSFIRADSDAVSKLQITLLRPQ